MKRPKKVRDYFEPWTARVRQIDLGEPVTEGLTDEQASRAVDAHRRAEANAGWMVWGSRMVEPCLVSSLMGKIRLMDDSGILLHVRNPHAGEDCDLKAEHIATRVAECVNACRGLSDPEATLSKLRNLLGELCRGDAERDDVRVVSLYAALCEGQKTEEPHP